MGCFIKTDIKLATVYIQAVDFLLPVKNEIDSYFSGNFYMTCSQNFFWTATHFYYTVSGPHNHIHPSIL